MAASSLRRRIIGDFGRLLKAIPVERPQDLAKPGAGQVKVESSCIVKGAGTQFLTQAKVGDTLKITGIPEQIISKVISDEELEVKVPGIKNFEAGQPKAYKIIPKIDQSELFEHVWKALSESRCIGIFPEGGSHDRSDLLPLKAGITIMALGTMHHHKVPVTIVPCGLKYFKGHQFRSQVIVEYGRPFLIPQSYADLYAKDKREACNSLLKEIEVRLREVTLSAPSYRELTMIYMIRRIYLPSDRSGMTNEEENELYKRFAKGYSANRDKPEIKNLYEEVSEYSRMLKTLGIQDYEVKTIQLSFLTVVKNFVVSLVRLLFSLSFALPGLVLMTPGAIYLEHKAEKEKRRALAGSSVKVVGIDVMASNKIMSGLIVYPIACLIFTLSVWWLTGHYWHLETHKRFYTTAAFFVLWPIYTLGKYLLFNISVCIRSCDGATRHLKTLKARLLCIFYKNKIATAQELRKKIKKDITDVVNLYGPTTIKDFENDKLIDPDRDVFIHKKLDIDPAEMERSTYMNDLEMNSIFETLTELGL